MKINNVVSEPFLAWFYASRAERVDRSPQLTVALLVFSALCLCTAALGFFVVGYHWAFASINSVSTRIPEAALHMITSFGDATFILGLMLLMAQRRVPLLLAILVATLAGALVSNILKQYFNAPRPPSLLGIDTFNLFGKALKTRSFPSGHTMTAFLTATTLMYFTDKSWLRALFFVIAIGTGLSRIWIGVHWPVDTLVGAALGIWVGLLSVSAARRWSPSVAPGWIVFSLVLLSLTAISALFVANDYGYAQGLISFVALCALWRLCARAIAPLDLNETLKASLSSRPGSLFFLVLAVVTVYRVVVLTQGHIGLFYDEAYYYHWSLEPAFGYYSKPPMVAWLIALCTHLFGHSVVAVKLASPLLYSASAWLVFLLGRYLWDARAGFFVGTVFLGCMLVGFNAIFITTDAPLIFFWSLSLYLFVRASREMRLWLWLALGASVGCGMLSKYTMAALPLSLLVFMLIDKDHRRLLRRYQPWLAALVAGLLFALNLYWNSLHDWISFQHTREIAHQGDSKFSLLPLLEFLFAQIFVFGPIWSFYALMLVRRHRQELANSQHTPHTRLLLCAGLGVLVLVSAQALGSHAFVNWAAPWIVAASLGLGLTLSTLSEGARYLRRGVLVQLLLLSVFYHWPTLLNYVNIPATKSNNPYQRLAGWQDIAALLRDTTDQYPHAVLSSDARDLLAYLGFYLRPGDLRLARWNPQDGPPRDHYDLLFNMRNYQHTDTEFLFVSKSPLKAEIRQRFAASEELATLDLHVMPGLERKVYLYLLRGFEGYAH